MKLEFGFGKKSKKVTQDSELLKAYYQDSFDGGLGLLEISLDKLEHLKSEVETQRDFNFYALEDLISSSLLVTFLENLILKIGQDPKESFNYIEDFSNNFEDLEKVIAEITENHLRFILSDGQCKGCPHCENHQDVAPLIELWLSQNSNELIREFLVINAIEAVLKDLIFEFFKDHVDIIEEFTTSHIEELRLMVDRDIKLLQEA